MGGYIIDPIPQFCDNDKKEVIESWHFVSDHISEVRKNIFMFVDFIEIYIVVNKTFIQLLNVYHYFVIFSNVGWNERFHRVFQGISRSCKDICFLWQKE